MASFTTVFVGSYAPAAQPGIHGFALGGDGSLALLGSAVGIESPSFLALHPAGHTVYAVSEISDGAVWACALGAEPWSATPTTMQPSGGEYPCHLALSPDTRWLAVSNYGSGTVGVFPLAENGALGPISDLARHEGSGLNADRQEGPHAHSSIFSPDGRWLIVADLGIDALVIYGFDGGSGTLRQHAVIAAAPGAGPRHTTWHPDGTWLYCANELDNTVVAYAFDRVAGMLQAAQTVATLPAGVQESYVADLHFTPDGSHLLASNRIHDTLAILPIGADGRMSDATLVSCGGSWPRTFAITPDGQWVLVANQHSNAVSVLGLRAPGQADVIGSVEVAQASFVQCLTQKSSK